MLSFHVSCAVNVLMLLICLPMCSNPDCYPELAMISDGGLVLRLVLRSTQPAHNERDVTSGQHPIGMMTSPDIPTLQCW